MTNVDGYLSTFRVKELGRIFAGRWGPRLPDDDAGREDAALMLDHLAEFSDFLDRADSFLDCWAPWMALEEREAEKQRAATGGVRWRADRLGERLRLTPAERDRYRAWSIRPVNESGRALTNVDLKDARALKARERARRNRIKAKGIRLPKQRPRLDARGHALFEALPPHSWHSVTWLITQVEHLPAFSDKRGVKPAKSSMRRLVKRAIANLHQVQLIAVRIVAGPRGSVMEVSRSLQALRTNAVPTGTHAGQHTSPQR